MQVQSGLSESIGKVVSVAGMLWVKDATADLLYIYYFITSVVLGDSQVAHINGRKRLQPK